MIAINAIPSTSQFTSTQDIRDISLIYNFHLEKIFESADSPFSDYVILIQILIKIFKNLYWLSLLLFNDGLFYESDSLHPAVNGHLIKVKTFLDVFLGVETQNIDI